MLWTAVLLVMVSAEEVQPPAFFAPNEELHGYLLEAADKNPGLRARYEEWLAALQRIPQATALDDPMFTYNQFVQSELKRFKVSLSQKFPWFGTLRARGEKASAEADAALLRFYAERNRVFMGVKKAYFAYAYLAEDIRVTESQLDVLSYMEDVVKSKLALGLAAEDELLRVTMEKARVDDRHTQLEQMRPTLTARLNEALGCEVDTERPWPQAAAFPPPMPPAPIVLARVRTANPDLSAFDALIESRKKDAELAKKSGFPNFTLGIEYAGITKPRQVLADRPDAAGLRSGANLGRVLSGSATFDPITTPIDIYSVAYSGQPMVYSNGGEDDIMVTVSLNLPIWRKKVKAGIEEANLMASATARNKQKTALSLDSEARTAIFNVEDAQRRYRLYGENLLPQARLAYESLQSDYSTGYTATGFLDVLESVRTLLDYDLERVRAAQDWQTGAAELEYLMGGPWAEEETPESSPTS